MTIETSSAPAEGLGLNNPSPMEGIFIGRDYLLENLTPEQMEYLEFVANGRRALAAGDEGRATALMLLQKEKLREGRLSTIVQELGPYIAIIRQAIPLHVPASTRRREDHGEVRPGELGGNDEPPEEYSDPTTSSLWVQ